MRRHPNALLMLVAALAALAHGPAHSASTEEHRAKRPELFHPDTGLRISRQRAPTPDDVPGALRVSIRDVRRMIDAGVHLLDVGAAAQSRYDELDGTWLVRDQHKTLPGAVWLPEVGRGTLAPEMQAYLETNVMRMTKGDRNAPIIVFCIADCWMSWNATQRLTAMGYGKVHWFAEGIDGWLDENWKLEPVDPVPVNVD